MLTDNLQLVVFPTSTVFWFAIKLSVVVSVDVNDWAEALKFEMESIQSGFEEDTYYLFDVLEKKDSIINGLYSHYDISVRKRATDTLMNQIVKKGLYSDFVATCGCDC